METNTTMGNRTKTESKAREIHKEQRFKIKQKMKNSKYNTIIKHRVVATPGNLSVTLNSQLPLTANIPATTCSCRLMLHNIRRMRPFLTQGGEGSSRFWSRLWSSHTCVFILLAFYIWTSRPHYLV